MRDDYAFRHEVSAEELAADYLPDTKEMALANQIDTFTLTDYTGPLPADPTEREARVRQGKIDMRADRRMAARVRLGLDPDGPCGRDVRCDGFSI